jgi:hypothetical protein
MGPQILQFGLLWCLGLADGIAGGKQTIRQD